MQLQLPIFPKEAQLINEHVGVYRKDGIVQYIVNGVPVYSHAQDDINAFRFITSNFIHQGLCRKTEIERFFNVSEDSVYRYHKKFKEQGEQGFFGDDARKGKAHKITGERRVRIQAKLDKGQSVNSIARQEGVRESAIRYGIKQGYLKKKEDQLSSLPQESTPAERDELDRNAPLGEATTRFEDRVMCSLGKAGHAQPEFSSEQALCGAGVLFLLPALISQGLLKTKEVYRLPASHYYGVESVVMTLAFMALSRIKNPEQLKLCKPGEIGRLIGLDRIPEMKCLREKIKLLSEQNQSSQLNNSLIDIWYPQDDQSDASFLYIDGHVRIYYGSMANLPSKFISRQKLCLSATSEFWVNDAQGMPVMMVMGELTEKLQVVIETQIIPRLIEAKLISDKAYPLDKAQCTLVFDREAYEPAFFQRLWEKYRIATLTYRKNVKDIWNEESFESVDVTVMGQQINMDLCEQKTELGGYIFREVRRLSANGHQTAIITNNPEIKTKEVAGRMFARWSQENFFRYLIQDYDFDKMVSYGIETIDMEKVVVNPQYRNLTHQLKKVREKKQRVEAKFYPLVEQAIEEKLDNIPAITDKQMQYKQQIDQLTKQENELIIARKNLQPKIKLAQMPQEKRYNKLKTESKILMNVIKIICYRAESSVASILAPYLANADKEKRMVVKQIIQSNADLIPDYKEQTLTVKLYSLAAKRYNLAVKNIVQLLNDTETIFPGTSLKLVFTISSAI